MNSKKLILHLLFTFIQLCIIPMATDYHANRIHFNFLSRHLMMFILTQVLFWGFLYGINYLVFDQEQMKAIYIESFQKMNSHLTDMLSCFSFFWIMSLHPWISVIVARGASTLPPEVVLARDLKLPQYGYILIFGWVCSITGWILQFLVSYRSK